VVLSVQVLGLLDVSDSSLDDIVRREVHKWECWFLCSNWQFGWLQTVMQEKLYSMLQEVLKERPGVDIVKLHKSGGVVSRNTKYRQRSRIQKTKVTYLVADIIWWICIELPIFTFLWWVVKCRVVSVRCWTIATGAPLVFWCCKPIHHRFQ
jgi:hypothetical protein